MSTWVDAVKHELAVDKRNLVAYRQTLDTKDLHQAMEYDMVGEMISDMQFALEWIRRGRSPWSRRGVDQRGVYQRTELATMFPSLVPNMAELTIEDKHKILDILVNLSNRERACFILHVTKGLTYSEIGSRLKVSRTSVQKFVERARTKIQQWI